MNLRLDLYPTIMLAFVLLMLPLSLSLSNIFIILLLAISLYYIVVKRINVFRKFNHLDYLFIGVFLLHLISFLWTDNIPRFSSIIERNLSWLIFPLIFIGRSMDSNLFKKIIFFGFLVYAIINELMILEAFITSQEHIKTIELYFSRYYQLGNAIIIFDIHYAYLSLYNCIAIIMGFEYLKTKTKWYYYFGIAILLFYNFQLGSRTFFVINFILSAYFLLLVFKNGSSYTKVILIILLVGVSFWGKPILAHSYSRFTSRIALTFEKKDSLSDFNRLDRWKLGIEIIDENFWIGVSAADAKGELINKYNENQLYHSAKEKLNIHNQYLDYFIKFGIFGFLLLLLMISVLFYGAYINKNTTLMGVTFLFLIAFVTENYLSVQRGIVPFCLLALLLTNTKNQLREFNNDQ